MTKQSPGGIRCALCGRVTLNPAVMIGAMPVGPKCAQRGGLLAVSRRAWGVLSMSRPARHAYQGDDRTTMDLFAELPP